MRSTTGPGGTPIVAGRSWLAVVGPAVAAAAVLVTWLARLGLAVVAAVLVAWLARLGPAVAAAGAVTGDPLALGALALVAVAGAGWSRASALTAVAITPTVAPVPAVLQGRPVAPSNTLAAAYVLSVIRR